MKKPFLIFAHRGASTIYPENTLPAFREAIRMGANGLELDVQLSKDGCPVVIHDESLTRTTNGKGLVKNHTVKELKQLSAGLWFDPKYRGLKIPTLEEVLKRSKPRHIVLNIEMKNLLIRSENLEAEIIRLIRKYKMTNRVILSTFNPESIRIVRQIDPTITTSFLYFGKLDSPWKMALDLGASYIQPPFQALTKEIVQNCQKMDLLVCPYDVNNNQEIQLALEWDVDGLITLHPQYAKQFVK